MSAAPDQDFQPPPPPTEVKPRAPRPTKLRPFAIGFFALGLLVVGSGIAGLIPGGIKNGAGLAFFGVLLFAFSFIPLPVVTDSEPPLGFFEKITGIFYEPSRVFRNLRAYPHWVGAFALVVVLSLIYSTAFVQRITPERIVDYVTQKVAELPPPFTPSQGQIEQMRTQQLADLKNPIQRVGGMVMTMVSLFALGSFVAALCLLGVVAFGGRINFWQALAVIFYAWLPVTAIQKLLGLVILYLKSPEDLHPVLNQETTLQDNLSILFSAADHPLLFVVTSFIGLTVFYGVWLRARGLNQGATRVGSGAAWGVSITIYVLALLFVTVWTSLFPGFIS